MFCLRSWLPLLFIPTSASPAFIVLFFICSYFLNRPCVYCSVLLLILFLTSCNWSDRCFFDLRSNWFHPRLGGHGFAVDLANSTASTLAGAVADGLSMPKPEWTGMGMEWLRSLLGKREWRIDCLDINIRL
ncbi:hypothetical protein CDD82_2946 [Ophiocordyceps australis]|uniref:Uncharacterized protein n=1 Tax=Ophiocordyceps australis TaxID=1399860 RepID=A0A2C5ZGQ3_9HYPO|nr:hypothetical protein CDD82_2946 [Ophiocordyceps australis]